MYYSSPADLISIQGNANHGVYVENSDFSISSNSEISGNGRKGIFLGDTSHMYSGDQLDVYIHDNGEDGIYFYNYSTVWINSTSNPAGVRIQHNGEHGIQYDGSSFSTNGAIDYGTGGYEGTENQSGALMADGVEVEVP